jgi:hypothetical protein
MNIDFSLIFYLITSIINLIGKFLLARKKYNEKAGLNIRVSINDPDDTQINSSETRPIVENKSKTKGISLNDEHTYGTFI